MKDLIEALTIFMKYEARDLINCSHDELAVCIDPSTVSAEDRARLKELSFHCRDEDEDGKPCEPQSEYFYSFRFGSC